MPPAAPAYLRLAALALLLRVGSGDQAALVREGSLPYECPPRLRRPPVPHPIRTWNQLCIVSHEHKFVYLAIPKTGSSTTRVLLMSQFCGPVKQHTLELREHCPPGVLARVPCSSLLTPKHSNYTFFAVTRDPWLRAGSCWTYGLKCYDNFKKARSPQPPQSPYPPYPSFQSALVDEGYTRLPLRFLHGQSSHFGPQAHFLVDALTGQSAVDYRVRLEHLQDDLACFLPLRREALRPERIFAHENPEGLPEQMDVQRFYSADFLLLGSLSLGIAPSPLTFELRCSPLDCVGEDPCWNRFCGNLNQHNLSASHLLPPAHGSWEAVRTSSAW